jgi:HTH-type transcriptional regulator/antitoxin HigA
MDAGERDYADALAMFLREFERARHLTSLLTLAPVDRLKFLMAEKAMTVNELGKVLGSQSSASLILHGKRAISKAHILKLSQHFAVSPALFIE